MGKDLSCVEISGLCKGFPMILSGILTTLPVVLGYLPYAMAFGILSRQAGLSCAETLFMTLAVYAGASQIIVMGLLLAGQTHASMILTTLMVNLRYLFLNASLAPFLSGWPWLKKSLFGFTVSDETFAIHSVRFTREGPRAPFAFAVNLTAYLAWAIFSLIGYAASSLAPDLHPWGLDFALPAVFIGLLLALIQNRLLVVVAIFSGGVALFLHQVGLRNSSVMITALVGAVLGASIELWAKKI